MSFPAIEELGCSVCGMKRFKSHCRSVKFTDLAEKELLSHMRRVLVPARRDDMFADQPLRALLESALERKREHPSPPQDPEDLKAAALLRAELTPPSPPEFHGSTLDSRSVETKNNTFNIFTSCENCCLQLSLPPDSIANDNWYGEIPPELQDMSICEQLLISPYRQRNIVVKLVAQLASGVSHSATAANAITFAQDIADVFREMPLSLEEMASSLTIIFIGPLRPSRKDPAIEKEFIVRHHKVCAAVHWLHRHNKPWRDVCHINMRNLMALPENDVPDAVWQRLIWDSKGTDKKEQASYNADNSAFKDNGIRLASGVVDVDAHGVSAQDKRNAAQADVARAAGIRIPRSYKPVSDSSPHFVALCYVHLYPYGIGGPERDSRRRKRRVYISEERLIARQLMLLDERFATDPALMFTTFNRIQREKSLLQSRLVADSKSFVADVQTLNSINALALAQSLRRLDLSHPDARLPASDPLASKLNVLLRRVQMVQRRLPGTNEARKMMRCQLFSLSNYFGCASLFITINPSDTSNPACMYLAGVKLDLSLTAADLPPNMPSTVERASIIARNPVAAARFFDRAVNAFIACLLGYKAGTTARTKECGVFGKVSAYGGSVETQGRGTEHLHMLVYLAGAPDPGALFVRLASDEAFRTQVLHWVDQCMSTALPPIDNSWAVVADTREDLKTREILRSKRIAAPDLEKLPSSDDVKTRQAMHRAQVRSRLLIYLLIVVAFRD